MTVKDLRLPLSEHLEEIRRRLLVVVLAFAVFSVAAFYFMDDILAWLKIPGGTDLGTLAVFSPTSAILTFLKMAFFFGLVFSLPVLLYEIWMFIRPALTESMGWFGVLFIILGTGLFWAGAGFSFYFLIPASLKFLLSLGRGELQFIISLDSYISFVLLFMLAGGAIFQIPLLAFFLAKLNLLTPEMMIRYWKLAVVGSFIAAALVTPTPDIVNMLILALPILLLYGVSIGIVTMAKPAPAPQS